MSGTETGRASVESAFERITYLLDRELAPAYRVRAFLTAAEVVGDLSDAELDQRVATETLTDLEHIGDKTAAVIAEAYRGETPGGRCADGAPRTGLVGVPARSVSASEPLASFRVLADVRATGASISA
jgi:DNA polymerase/3'-5' exonuclease PolX